MTQNLKILLIDDSIADAALVKAYLKRSEQYTVEWSHCETSEDGVTCIEKERFDLVFLDYLLDEKTGLDILTHINEHGISVPVVFLTGMASEEVVGEAMRLGARVCLQKDDLGTGSLDSVVTTALG